MQTIKLTDEAGNTLIVNATDKKRIDILRENGYAKEGEVAQEPVNPFIGDKFRFHAYQYTDVHGYKGFYVNVSDGEIAGVLTEEDGALSIEAIEDPKPTIDVKWKP